MYFISSFTDTTGVMGLPIKAIGDGRLALGVAAGLDVCRPGAGDPLPAGRLHWVAHTDARNRNEAPTTRR
jgi:hypothetical protein